MDLNYDVIVIGAGHNGLVCANYLARRKLKVLVLEKRGIVGGACVTEELWPKTKVSSAAYVCSLMDKEIIDDLNLQQHGFKFLVREPPSFTPFLDGRYLFLHNDLEKSRKEIAKFSKKDAENYSGYESSITKLAETIEPLLKQTPPKNMYSMVRFGLKNLKMLNGLIKLIDFASISEKDFLDRWFESEELKATLATDGIIGSFASPSTPGTAYVLLHHVMGNIAGRGKWGYVEGGMGSIANTLAKSAEELGVRIATNSAVEKILVEDGKAVGVITKDGQTYRAKRIVSNAEPKLTFLNLIGQEHLPEEFVQKVRNYKTQAASFKVNFLLKDLPNFDAYQTKNGLGPEHMGTIHMCEDFEYMERAFDDAKYGRTSERPVVEMCIPSSVDKTLAPEGMYIASCFVQYTPYKLIDSNWEQEKGKFIRRVVSTIKKYAPNIEDIIVNIHGLSPLDLETEYSLTGGNIFHGDITLNQLFLFRFNYTTPIKNLYMCGSGTHPGGGVTGLTGYNAAREILND